MSTPTYTSAALISLYHNKNNVSTLSNSDGTQSFGHVISSLSVLLIQLVSGRCLNSGSPTGLWRLSPWLITAMSCPCLRMCVLIPLGGWWHASWPSFHPFVDFYRLETVAQSVKSARWTWGADGGDLAHDGSRGLSTSPHVICLLGVNRHARAWYPILSVLYLVPLLQVTVVMLSFQCGLFVCLSVCLYAGLQKNYQHDFHETWCSMGQGRTHYSLERIQFTVRIHKLFITFVATAR